MALHCHHSWTRRRRRPSPSPLPCMPASIAIARKKKAKGPSAARTRAFFFFTHITRAPAAIAACTAAFCVWLSSLHAKLPAAASSCPQRKLVGADYMESWMHHYISSYHHLPIWIASRFNIDHVECILAIQSKSNTYLICCLYVHVWLLRNLGAF